MCPKCGRPETTEDVFHCKHPSRSKRLATANPHVTYHGEDQARPYGYPVLAITDYYMDHQYIDDVSLRISRITMQFYLNG